MLILTRKKNESIVIGDEITVVVVEIRGDKVRLGIEYPAECSVHRREVYDAIHRSDESRKSSTTVTIPGAGMEALERIRCGISSPRLDDGTLIAAVLEAVAEKGITAEDVESFKENI